MGLVSVFIHNWVKGVNIKHRGAIFWICLKNKSVLRSRALQLRFSCSEKWRHLRLSQSEAVAEAEQRTGRSGPCVCVCVCSLGKETSLKIKKQSSRWGKCLCGTAAAPSSGHNKLREAKLMLKQVQVLTEHKVYLSLKSSCSGSDLIDLTETFISIHIKWFCSFCEQKPRKKGFTRNLTGSSGDIKCTFTWTFCSRIQRLKPSTTKTIEI